MEVEIDSECSKEYCNANNMQSVRESTTTYDKSKGVRKNLLEKKSFYKKL